MDPFFPGLSSLCHCWTEMKWNEIVAIQAIPSSLFDHWSFMFMSLNTVQERHGSSSIYGSRPTFSGTHYHSRSFSSAISSPLWIDHDPLFVHQCSNNFHCRLFLGDFCVCHSVIFPGICSFLSRYTPISCRQSLFPSCQAFTLISILSWWAAIFSGQASILASRRSIICFTFVGWRNNQPTNHCSLQSKNSVPLLTSVIMCMEWL